MLEVRVADRRRSLEARNRDVRALLDHVGRGFLAADLDGVVSPEHSAALVEWFGPVPPGARLWEYLGAIDARFGAWLEVGWPELVDGLMPAELTLARLPARLRHGERHFPVGYHPADRRTRCGASWW